MKTNDPIFDQYTKKLFNFLAAITSESDRAAIILGIAQIDDLLMQILIKALKPVKEKNDELLNADNALGTLSSRINMVYRLGLISDDLRKVLHILKKLRNDFAHNVFECDINKSPHKDRILIVEEFTSKSSAYDSLLNSTEKGTGLTGMALRGRVSIGMIVGLLFVIELNCKPIFYVNKTLMEKVIL